MSNRQNAAIEALLQKARGLRDTGDASAAVEQYREALARLRTLPEREPVLLVESLRGLAGALLDTDLPHESACVPAEEALRQALDVEREQNGESLVSAAILLDLAEFIHDHDHCDEAADTGRKAWDIAMRAGADGAEVLLEAADWLAWWCEAHEDWDWAEELLQQSLARLRQMLGAGHPRLAALCSSLANAYLHRGQLDQADALAARAYDWLVTAYGEFPVSSHLLEDGDRPLQARLAMSVLLSVRGSAAAQRGELPGAGYLWRKALVLIDAMDTTELGEAAENLAANRAQIFGSLAEVSSAQGRQEEAERLFRLSLSESAEAPDLRAELLQRYAGWLDGQQRTVEARDAREEARRLLDEE